MSRSVTKNNHFRQSPSLITARGYSRDVRVDKTVIRWLNMVRHVHRIGLRKIINYATPQEIKILEKVEMSFSRNGNE